MKITVAAGAVVALLALAACGAEKDAAPGAATSADVAPRTAASAAAAGWTGQAGDQKPIRVLFFVGDGYGIVPMTAARIFTVGESGELAIDRLPESAFVKTWSLDAQVTDSAPSMAAYMTGVKSRNEVLAMDGDTKAVAPGRDTRTGVGSAVDNCPTAGNGQPARTLLELAIAQGRATGVVTTARLTHATPAATYAHTCHRNAEYEIARQAVPGGEGFNAALGDGIDVLLGGISRYWQPFHPDQRKAGRPDGRNLVAELEARGYQAISDRQGLIAAAGHEGRLIGLFDFAEAEGHMSYDLDRDANREPSLAEMTLAAMQRLAANPAGYFLMVEGGRIDHALHGTNARRALGDARAFDAAVAAAIDQARQDDPDLVRTLVVVTADHDHTMVMNGYAALAGPSSDANPGILGLMRDYAAPGKPAVDADGMPFTTLVFGNGENRIAGPRDAMTPLTDAAAFALDYHQEAVIPMPVGGETHGGSDVFLGAIGRGADGFHGVIDNTEVFDIVRKASGL